MDCSRGILRGEAWLPLAALAVSIGAGCMRQTQHAPDVWAAVNGREIKRDEVDKYYRTRVNPEGQGLLFRRFLSLGVDARAVILVHLVALDFPSVDCGPHVGSMLCLPHAAGPDRNCQGG